MSGLVQERRAFGSGCNHYENLPIFAQNIDCEAVLMSTHNRCFGAKIRKIGIPLHTPFLLHKSGVQRGIHFTDMLE